MAVRIADFDPLDLLYPDSDGKPMADNLTQARVIRTLVIGFERLYATNDDVVVGGDFFWYPVEGRPDIVVAADVMVIVGTPKQEFRSYQQWRFGGEPVLAVEVLSHKNTRREMDRKRAFYDRHGVHEYWEFDPLKGRLQVFERRGDTFQRVAHPELGWTSPTTGVTISVEGVELVVHDPRAGRRWLAPAREGQRADLEAERADVAAARAEAEAARADVAAARAEAEAARAEAEAARADELAREVARLRALLDQVPDESG